MDSFRDQQFCPLARAAEILGHRWVLPILRELTVGPPRFSDFRRRLPGISSSMRADRLAAFVDRCTSRPSFKAIIEEEQAMLKSLAG